MLLNQFLLLSAILFTIGVYGVIVRKNGVLVLMSIELVLNAVNINLIVFSTYWGVAGQVFALFTIAIAAAEVGVGLAIVLLIYRNLRSADIDELDEMKEVLISSLPAATFAPFRPGKYTFRFEAQDLCAGRNATVTVDARCPPKPSVNITSSIFPDTTVKQGGTVKFSASAAVVGGVAAGGAARRVHGYLRQPARRQQPLRGRVPTPRALRVARREPVRRHHARAPGHPGRRR